jgi:Glutaminase
MRCNHRHDDGRSLRDFGRLAVRRPPARQRGIGGGIVTVAPGKDGLGTFSPLLDEAGNSVRGQLAARFLSRALGLDLFASEATAVRP